MPVTWPDDVDAVLGGDPTAGLAYLTPARGAVVASVAPIGLRDRDAGTVSFTTSLGFARKLDRLERDPRIALAYHARDHGFADAPLFVLVHARVRPFSRDPDLDRLQTEVAESSARFLGPRKSGPVWDRLLREYYQQRLVLDADVERVVVWRDLRCAGEPTVHGSPRAAEPPPPQSLPKNGAGPRVNADRAGKRLTALDHQLLAWAGADGFPDVAPVTIASHAANGIRLGTARPDLLPPGGRRAGLLGHAYRPNLVGLRARQHTGWLTVADDGAALYAPHTANGFRAPANKTALLVLNGLLAKYGVVKARRAARAGA